MVFQEDWPEDLEKVSFKSSRGERFQGCSQIVEVEIMSSHSQLTKSHLITIVLASVVVNALYKSLTHSMIS